MLRYAHIKVLLEVVLKHLVQRKHKTVTVHRGVIEISAVIRRLSYAVSGIYSLSVGTAQIVVIVRFQTVHPVTLEVCKADYACRECFIGVIALAALLGDNAVRPYLVFRKECVDKRGLRLFHLALYYVILASDIFTGFKQLILIRVQYLRQTRAYNLLKLHIRFKRLSVLFFGKRPLFLILFILLFSFLVGFVNSLRRDNYIPHR